MTYWSTSGGLGSVGFQGVGEIAVSVESSSILQEYVDGSEPTDVSAPFQFQLSGGRVGVLYTAVTGWKLVLEDPTVESGWRGETVPAPPGPVAASGVTADDDGSIYIAVMLSGWPAKPLYWIIRDAHGHWGGWSAVPSIDPAYGRVGDANSQLTLMPPEGPSADVEMWVVVGSIDKLTVAWISLGASAAWNYLWTPIDVSTSPFPLQSTPPVFDPGHLRLYTTMPFITPDGNKLLCETSTGVIAFTKLNRPDAFLPQNPIISESNKPGNSWGPWGFSSMGELGLPHCYNDGHVTYVISQMFGRDQNGNRSTLSGSICLFDFSSVSPQRCSTAPADVIYTGALAAGNSNLSSGGIATSIRSGAGGNGVTVLLRADPSGDLWSWSSTDPVVDPTQSLVRSGLQVDALADLGGGRPTDRFIAVAGGKLVELGRDIPETPNSSGDWSIEDIVITWNTDSSPSFVPILSHSTVIIPTDASGAPMPGASATIACSSTTSMRINNGSRVSAPAGASSSCAVGPDGRLRITTPADRLSTSTLTLTVQGSDGAEHTFTVDPSAPQLNRLMALQNGGLDALVPAGNVSEVQGVLAKVAQARGGSRAALVTRHRAGQHSPGADPTVGAAAPHPGGAWRLTFDHGQLSFSELTIAEFDSAAVGRELPTGSEQGLFSWLADVLEELENLAEQTGEFLLQQVGSTISGWITVAGQQLAVVAATLDEYLDLCQAILHAAAVKWEEVTRFFGWLLSDSAAQIWQAHKDYAASLSAGFGTASAAVQQAAAHLSSAQTLIFSTSGTWANSSVDIAPTTDMTCKPAPGLPTETRQIASENSSVLDWLFERIQAVIPGTDLPTLDDTTRNALQNPFAGVDTAKLQTDAADLLTYLTDTPVDQIDTTQIATKLAAIGSDIWTILQDGIAAVLNVATAALKAVQDVLDEPIASPAVVALYNLLNPGPAEQPTMTKLLALMAAAPAVVLAEMAFGGYPDTTAADGSGTSTAVLKDPSLYVAGVYQISAWNVIDLTLDLLKPTDLAPAGLWMFLSAAGSLPMILAGIPENPNLNSVAAASACFNSALGVANWLLNLGCIIFKGKGSRAFPIPAGISLGLAAAQSGCQIATAITGPSEDRTANWLTLSGLLPAIAKIVRQYPTTPATEGAISVLDLVGNTAAGTARIMKAF